MRLTEKCWRNLDPWECCGQDKYCKRGCHDEGGCTNGCKVPKMYCELAKYEDLEEQGLLLRLPCKVGDKVWGIIRYFFRDRNQNPYEICECKFELSMLKEIGKTIFLTKKEAEAALAEKGGAE